MSDAESEILARVRARLAADPGRDAPLPPVLRGAPVALGERVERFQATLQGIGGKVERVPDLATALARVAALVAERGIERVARSDAPELDGLEARLPAGVVLQGPEPREGLLAAGLGVTSAQWGIAETGTLVLCSSDERHRLVSLLPPVHVALLATDRVLGTLGDALAATRGSGTVPRSRTITFVTGPSRTGDIELTLVVGVHGPRELHVLLHGPDP